MSKKPVAYVKPQDPSFLVKLKKEAGYVEGPTVDTKRQQPDFDSGSDDERNEEKPVVVVINEGDITEEEAAIIESKLKAEQASAKADLSQRVVFQKPVSSKRSSEEGVTKNKKKTKKEKDRKKPVLSFDEEEES